MGRSLKLATNMQQGTIFHSNIVCYMHTEQSSSSEDTDSDHATSGNPIFVSKVVHFSMSKSAFEWPSCEAVPLQQEHSRLQPRRVRLVSVEALQGKRACIPSMAGGAVSMDFSPIRSEVRAVVLTRFSLAALQDALELLP